MNRIKKKKEKREIFLVPYTAFKDSQLFEGKVLLPSYVFGTGKKGGKFLHNLMASAFQVEKNPVAEIVKSKSKKQTYYGASVISRHDLGILFQTAIEAKCIPLEILLPRLEYIKILIAIPSFTFPIMKKFYRKVVREIQKVYKIKFSLVEERKMEFLFNLTTKDGVFNFTPAHFSSLSQLGGSTLPKGMTLKIK